MLRGRLDEDAQKRFKDFVDMYATDPEMLSDLFAQSEDPEADVEIKQLVDKTIDETLGRHVLGEGSKEKASSFLIEIGDRLERNQARQV